MSVARGAKGDGVAATRPRRKRKKRAAKAKDLREIKVYGDFMASEGRSQPGESHSPI
jgi:hypothetical protein